MSNVTVLPLNQCHVYKDQTYNNKKKRDSKEIEREMLKGYMKLLSNFTK